MRILVLFAALGLALVGYTGYWFYLAGAVERQLGEQRDDWRERGVEVDYGTLAVTGYPYRLTLRGGDVTLSAPQGPITWTWRAPVIDITAQPWSLRHWVAVIRQPSRLELRATESGAGLAVTAATGRVSVIVDGRGAPRRASFDVRDVTLLENNGSEAVDIARLEVHLRRPEDGSASLDAVTRIDDLDFPEGTGGVFGRHVALALVSATVREQWPGAFSREAIGRWRDDGGTVEVRRLQLLWGPLSIDAEGTLALDPAFRPIGAMTATVKGYGALLEALGNAGLLTEEGEFAARVALNLLAEPAPDDGRPMLRVPVSAQDGFLHLGPVPLIPLAPVVAR